MRLPTWFSNKIFFEKKSFDRVRNDFTNDQYCVKRAILNYQGIIPPSFLRD